MKNETVTISLYLKHFKGPESQTFYIQEIYELMTERDFPSNCTVNIMDDLLEDLAEILQDGFGDDLLNISIIWNRPEENITYVNTFPADPFDLYSKINSL